AGLAAKFGGTAVLKGAGSLISADPVPYLCVSGNPGMAAPGMGDGLTGIIAALSGQGIDGDLAAAIGVEVHARAGDRAAASG
ncbi:bifunctional ADP-dependent NAD(P)H-hydrate dehydratase/NAD(P)H-hydrate epimerase, partial [Enterococcus hirae]